MCILCVIQKWSRRIATMLPWFVIPMIGLWALSQVLPPAFRFEITSPRLACVFVLLITLFWYEVLMPQLSSWRVQRNARLRERKMFEAIEMQKLRKTATRRCRNCLTAYRDQNPSGGKFMCSYCGHISRRPVLDLPVPPGLGFSNSGVFKDLVGKSGKVLNGKAWSDNGWICGQDWLENGNWVGGPFSEKSSYWQENGVRFFCGDDDCMEEASYSRVVIFACKILRMFCLSIRCVWRKMTRVCPARDDSLSDAEHKGMLGKQDEIGANFQESKGEKARRKAEEKRQARLEREQLEEEERKQREEVARLVEERRRLRGEEMEAEKDRSRGSTAAVREKDIKKEAERKRQDKRKEKDKGSSKSNSDAEEMERRAGKETERKWEFDRKSETDRWESHRTGSEHAKASGTEMAHGIKVANTNNHSPGKTRTRYVDQMRGTIFGKGANTAAAMSRENKPNDSVDHVHASANWRESFQSEKNLSSGDKTVRHPVVTELQPPSVPKKSWHQLFSRSSAVPQPANSNVISRPNGQPQAQVQSPPLAGHSFPAQSYANPIEFGLPSLFTLPTFPTVSTSTGFVPPLTPKAMFSRFGEGRRDFLPDESEMFGDPCYVPDPVSLLGPVSESLNNFQLDLCTGFSTDMGSQKPRSLKNISAPAECSRPSPIESPMSRVQHASTMKAQNMYPSPIGGLSNANAGGTWQMWSTSPLGQDGLGLVGGSASWLLSPDLNSSNKEDLVHPMSHKTMASLFTKNGQAVTSTCSPQNVFLGNCQNGGTFVASVPGGTLDPWLPQTLVGTGPGMENNFPRTSPEEASQNDMIYGSPRAYTTNHQAALSPANFAKKDWAMQCSGENNRSTPVTRAHISGLYSTRDAQSFWSYD